ncbi:hypothetical protein D3C80_1756250 [compost metagenome]
MLVLLLLEPNSYGVPRYFIPAAITLSMIADCAGAVGAGVGVGAGAGAGVAGAGVTAASSNSI